MNNPIRTLRIPPALKDSAIEMTSRSFPLRPSSFALLALLSIGAVSTNAQTIEPGRGSAPVPEKKVVVETTSANASLGSDETLVLNPFEVNTSKDRDFTATNAGTATKLGLDMKDMAAPYSVMTGEFIKALGITDTRAAVFWSTGGTQVFDGQGSDPFGLSGASTTATMYSIRGVTLNAGQQRNFFLTGSLGDTYNVDRIDFGRGPNAVLFNVGSNSVLGGGISTQGKRAMLGNNETTVGATVGSWDYYRATLDVNQSLGDRAALRLNLMEQKRGGWMDGEFENREGITLASTFKLTKKTELRAEASYDKTERATVPFPYFDFLSGWNGSTYFNGPITDAQLNGFANVANGTALASGRGPQGSSEGVDRVNSPTYVYDPVTNMVQNWIHTAVTRRGDANEWVPLYLGNTVFNRNGNASILPFGNSDSTAANRTPSGVNQNANAAAFLDMVDLPGNRFDRQIANSKFTVPGHQFSAMPDMPLYTQRNKDINLALTHGFNHDLFVEIAADWNQLNDVASIGHLNLRNGLIDLNATLPNGTPNPNFKKAYSQSNGDIQYREYTNWGIRANLGYIKDLGKWGHYTFNVSGTMNDREVDFRRKVLSMADLADSRMWHAGNEQIQIRNYWGGSNHASLYDIKPTSVYDKTPATTGTGAAAVTTYSTASKPINPAWVLSDWFYRKEQTKSAIFAFAARYFDDKLVISPGVRFDNTSTYFRNRVANWAAMPNNPNWDGVTLTDSYWRPDAPTDWKSYINSNRPTVVGLNDVNPLNPGANDKRYRGDYNQPKGNYDVMSTTAGATYHLFPWVALKASYGTSYLPGTIAKYDLQGNDVDPDKGTAYEAAVTFNLFKNRLSVTPRYYHNLQENILGFPVGSISTLMGRRAWTDGNTSGRNPFGYTDVLGADYQKVENNGIEIELSGTITRGWRVTGSYATAQATNLAGRFPNTQAYVLSRVGEYKQVLEAAGGFLDTTQKPVNAGHTITDAPGIAIADPAITNAMIAAAGGDTGVRANAVTDYNNIWRDYDNMLLSRNIATIGNKYKRINFYTDYTVQTGKLKGLTGGIGLQYSDQVVAGYYSAQTIANPAYNPALPITNSNLTYIDDPSVDVNSPVYAKRPVDTTLTLGYSRRLPNGWGMLGGKEFSLQLTVHNILNKQDTFYQDDGVANRPPGGDPNLGYRETVVTRVAMYQRPINYELQASLKF